jgi:ammonium transporter, Amt family
LGLFATGQYGAATSLGPDASSSFKGLFYGGGTHQLQFQIFGSLVVCATTFAIALIVMYAVNALGVLRISPDHELEGLDIVEHGAPAYHPEYAYMGYSPIPAGRSPGIATPPMGATVPVGGVGD